MEHISMDELKELANINNSNCISIYIPTHHAGKEVLNGEDQILLKNQIQKAKVMLQEKGMQDVEINNYLKPLSALLDDKSFWRHQSSGLAIFLAENFFKFYRVPLKFAEYCMISHSFHLKQLLPLLNGNGVYYVLALSLSNTKFFRADRDSIEEIPFEEDIPDSLEESMKHTEIEKSLQFHSGAGPGGAGANAGRGASGIFHGQAKGVQRDDRKVFIGEFFRKVDKLVFDELKDKEAPLVLIGVEYFQPLYKGESSVKTIFDKGINGSPDEMHPKEIHQKTWQLVEPHFNKVKEEVINKYHQLAGTGKTSYDLQKIVPAAVNGRVESIFIAKGSSRWGKYQEEGEELKIEVHDRYEENDDDLVSMSAVTTVLNGGKTFIVDKEEMPEPKADTEIVAVYRY